MREIVQMGDRWDAAAAGQVFEWIEAYLADPRRFPVLSQVRPGEIRDALPAEAPLDAESFAEIFRDFERIVMPGITHWNHPRFFAYFAISAAPVAILAEALAATLDVNAMLWRTSPAATELEEVVLEWLRKLLGLPAEFHGIVYDTASIGGFTALAAAREALELDIRERGMAGRPEISALRVYVTEHTHSHIEKGAIALGVGRQNVVRIAVDERFAMRADVLDATIRADRSQGFAPMCIAATVGTTSTTSSDPLAEIARVAHEQRVWLHVDAAYAGAAAILPEFRHLLAGAEKADSIVVNPHKWLFVPIDLSVLYVRDLENLRRAFSLIPDFLATSESGVRNYMDYGLQLGRRFRALKFWFVLRGYGANGMRERLRRHIALAQTFASWVEAADGWEVAAPHPLSVVCFRHRSDDGFNDQLVERANATGSIFISATKLEGRTTLRLAIGNEGTTEDDVRVAWEVLQTCAAELLGSERSRHADQHPD